MSRRAVSPATKVKPQPAPQTPPGNNAKRKDQAESPSVHYEFGGPVGAACTMVALPLVIYCLYFSCGPKGCAVNTEALTRSLAGLQNTAGLIGYKGACLFGAWMIGQVLLERVLPGEQADGVQLRDGSRLKYCLSGHLQFWVTLAILLSGLIESKKLLSTGGIVALRPLPLGLAYDLRLHVATASMLFCMVFSLYLYLTSLRCDKSKLAAGGQTGNVVYDFFIGRELNPRVGSLDLKQFCELRPGLIGWVALNLSCAFKQYEKLGHVTMPMFLINLFQGLYVWDALYNERAILTTMDITTDGFGFMLVFGDLAWVPFTYSLQSYFLVDHDPQLSSWALVVIVALKLLGYCIFRGSNGEKDRFRRDPSSPDVAHLKTMTTRTGRKLLVSGWWGLARKINYTGDWLMGLSWCLLCGTKSIIPYFYAIYFLILLVHRASRDDEFCREKYGSDWDAYKKKVPYVFIPYVV
eukprot:gnl/MRDRNA2_/MRDRNA2_108460_c0_seq1.p1 gnl/MRDRNA2_/MRDRNA2_108460_c0~~gnl/MRDRNA2_/MRDRNA2_108460_c0_seq1.p1  ORF type:complete len:466 (+),score=60.91 gnl/MRDRNA2_/MRDRNA2_108460_c0_seq1:66-1463(+)